MASPIKRVVIFVKENHTFDNYFGKFPGANGDAKLKPAPNPPSFDPDHRHQAWMDRANDHRYEIQYSRNEIPEYFKLAQQYTLCDNYFSEVAGPSTPNHLMLICADAPIINNPAHHYRPAPQDAYNLSSLPKRLEDAKLTWGNYGGYAFHYVKELAGHSGNHTSDLFVHHAAAGNLPTVSWVYAEGRPSLSEHPPQNITDGMNWSVEQIKAIVTGGLWNDVAIFITWDDWGGWFDHVTPTVVEKWSHTKAQRQPDEFQQYDGQPFRYGSRVPCLVISPYAKAGHVSTQLNSHVSIVKFCADNFGVKPMNTRDGSSNGMSDCFDFQQKPLNPPVW